MELKSYHSNEKWTERHGKHQLWKILACIYVNINEFSSTFTKILQHDCLHDLYCYTYT